MNPIFVIVGPPAVGKSTTSRALAEAFPKSIHIPVDSLRTMVISGLTLPQAAWNDELAEQIALARAAALHMAGAYHQAGYAVVIDDFVDPRNLSEYRALASHVRKLVLYPSQAEAHRRSLQREGNSPARDYIDEGIREVYRHLSTAADQLARDGWRIVDTSALSPEATVAQILRGAPSGE